MKHEMDEGSENWNAALEEETTRIYKADGSKAETICPSCWREAQAKIRDLEARVEGEYLRGLLWAQGEAAKERMIFLKHKDMLDPDVLTDDYPSVKIRKQMRKEIVDAIEKEVQRVKALAATRGEG